MAEQEIRSDEASRVANGADPRDISVYSTWRDTTDSHVQKCLSFYAEYLSGQTSGMTDALSLPSVLAACELEGVDTEARPEMTHRMFLIHREVMDIVRSREKAKHRG